MDITLFFALFAIMGALYTFMGYKASQSISSLDDYFLAGRAMKTIPLAIALIATQLGGGVILGTSFESYHYGLYGLLYVIGISLGFIILGCGLAGKMRAYNVATTAELFELYYNSTILKKIASLLSIASLFGILLAQIVASYNLMSSLAIYSPGLFIAFWLLVIGYTMFGGLKAIVNNDIFQLSFIIMVFCGLFIYEIITQHALSTLSHALYSLTTSIPPLSYAALASTILMPALYLLIEQDIAQNIFAAKTPRTAIIATLLASGFMLIFAIIPVYFGIKASLSGLEVAQGANPLLMLLDRFYSSPLLSLVVYGVLAAIISTADALLCAISSHIVQDFTLFTDKKRALTFSKISILTIGLSALILVLSGLFSNIIRVIIGSYAIPVTALIVPLLVVYFKAPASKTAAFTSIIAGLGGFIYALYLQTTFPAELAGISASLAGYCIGYLVEKNN